MFIQGQWQGTSQSDDVFVDGRGLIYVAYCSGCGLDILECASSRQSYL